MGLQLRTASPPARATLTGALSGYAPRKNLQEGILPPPVPRVTVLKPGQDMSLQATRASYQGNGRQVMFFSCAYVRLHTLHAARTASQECGRWCHVHDTYARTRWSSAEEDDELNTTRLCVYADRCSVSEQAVDKLITHHIKSQTSFPPVGKGLLPARSPRHARALAALERDTLLHGRERPRI